MLRLFQGAASALLFSTATVIVILCYPPEARGRAIGLQVAGVYLGTTLGPVLGGIITHNAGWRALFMVVGAAASHQRARAVLEAARAWSGASRGTRRFDYLGSGVWIVALSAFLLGFSYLPALTGVILVSGGRGRTRSVLLAGEHAADPILSVDLLRNNRVFAFSNVAAFINYSGHLRHDLPHEPLPAVQPGSGRPDRRPDARDRGFLQTVLLAGGGPRSPTGSARRPRLRRHGACVLGLPAFVFLGETTPYWYIIVFCACWGSASPSSPRR